jgi:hypothetical protein
MPDAKARPILWSKFCRRKLENKKRIYARLGLKELWIIDPVPREVLVYRFEENLGEPVVSVCMKATLPPAHCFRNWQWI